MRRPTALVEKQEARHGISGDQFEAGPLDVGVLFAQLVEPLPELHEDRVGQVPGDAGSDQLLDIFDVDLLYTPARHQVLNGCSV